ncbi:DUF1330 domain-containing protein [Hellea balneolensis]|uniref:DUF1330 domain-containing protein n=1 Tax=Hellea balneolensis TaxID=287478 RepID=UPI000423ECDC|nr:DUF1330 domain-containing protein [Hellea balneolensis]
MSVFVLAQFQIHDPSGYAKYVEIATPIFMREGVKVLANDEAPQPITPGQKTDKVVLLEFRDHDHYKHFFTQPDYIEAAKHRDAASTITAMQFKRFEGFPG